MKNTVEYKGYTGSVEYSDEDGIFFGKVQFIRALIGYEGSNAEELRQDFHDGWELKRPQSLATLRKYAAALGKRLEVRLT